MRQYKIKFIFDGVLIRFMNNAGVILEMRFERFDLNLLAALDVLLDECNVGRAAERLHLSQPAMSSALNRLRKLLDDPILVRSGRGLEPTPRARELQISVRQILQRIRAELIDRPDFAPETSDRQFVIAASDYTIRTLLLPAFRDFSRTAPGIRFQVIPLGTNVGEDFSRGDTDLLIAPSQIVSPDHPGEVLFKDDYVVAAWSGNQRIGDEIDINTYFDLGHVSASFGKTAPAAFDEWLAQSTPRKRRIEISLPSFRDVPEMLVGTDRLATMHRCYAHDFSSRLPIRLFPIPFRHPGLVQIAQWHRLRSQDPGIQWLIAALRRHASRIGSASADDATDL